MQGSGFIVAFGMGVINLIFFAFVSAHLLQFDVGLKHEIVDLQTRVHVLEIHNGNGTAQSLPTTVAPFVSPAP